MKKIKYILLFTAFFHLSCEKEFLDVVPTDQVAASESVSSTTTAYAVLNGIHRDLYQRQEDTQGNSGVGGAYILWDLAGEDQVMHRTQWHSPIYNYTAQNNDADFYSRFPWVMFYKYIGNANILINGIENATGSQDDKNVILGQALLYRAWSHFNLVQTYGKRYVKGSANTQLGVPYKFTADEDNLARNTVEEVYGFINDDIDAAINALEGYARPNKSNINVNVAKGLKARVALTMGDWETAKDFAIEARQGFPLTDRDTYGIGFNINSESLSEIMWASQIQEDQHDRFGSYGGYISRNASTSAIRGNPRSINSLLYDKISDTDIRKGFYDPTGVHANLPDGYSISSAHQRKPYTSIKFLAVSAADTRVDVPHMRSAEMYLIEAEAKSHLQDDAGAAQTLFDFVSARDNAYVLSSNTGQTLLDEILTHRRIELWGEGFRFFDLKRLNLELDRTGANHIPGLSLITVLPPDDPKWEWLITREEMITNENMVQNPL